jgi:hypothetical protein
MTYQPDNILNTVFDGGDEPLGLKKKGIRYNANNYQLFGSEDCCEVIREVSNLLYREQL